MPLLDLPDIRDDDVRAVSKMLGLPQDAFFGHDGNDPRIEVLRSLETLDVEACPGSGKTTLLVAKLALLAKSWPYRRRGICILSHTNAARDEVEKRLGDTLVGQTLLRYPHYVGTIHGFVNEFLALPWLRSNGLSPSIIEDQVALEWRWRSLPPPIRERIERSPQNRNTRSFLKIIDTDFNVAPIGAGGRGQFIAPGEPNYAAIRTVLRRSYERGLVCFDEMFLWADNLLAGYPEVRQLLRERFPLLFVDEVQDNSELQSSMLYDIFLSGRRPVIRQRFGDINQAIFHSTGQNEGAQTDPFPAAMRKEIPSSFRFGELIAKLTSPFAIEKIEGGLRGRGPSTEVTNSDESPEHTIFLFDGHHIDRVLPAFAAHICDVFADDAQVLSEGKFVAVGAVHTTPSPGNEQVAPHYVGHYWPQYDSSLSRKEPVPNSFVGYLRAGSAKRRESALSYWMTELLAEAILRTWTLVGGARQKLRRNRKHRYIVETLRPLSEAATAYRLLVCDAIQITFDLTKDDWVNIWVPRIHQIVVGLAGNDVEFGNAKEFLSWQDHIQHDGLHGQRAGPNNVFEHETPEGSTVSIRLGSIHSVKGQTHTATLVLDTFLNGRNGKTNLQYLKEWLLGRRAGRGREGVLNVKRLKLHFVGMTRPSHLLCIAMRSDSFTAAEIKELEEQTAWKVKFL